MKLLVISNVHVEPNSSAAGGRMKALLYLFHQWGYEIHFATTAGQSQYADDLSEFSTKKYSIKVNDDNFDTLINRLSPEVVMFDRFMTEEQFGWRVAKQCPDALRILDTEDLHTLRYARQYAVTNHIEFTEDLLVRDIAFREIAAIFRSDLTLMISSYEMALIQRVFSVEKRLLHYLPFMVEPPDSSNWLPFAERNHFVSIGNFRHAPNSDAVHRLKSVIWPLIRNELPDSELHVYGAYLTENIKTLHDPETGFLIKGRAESASEVLGKAKVLLAPLRFGAGLKGKLIDAMIAGTPSITTSIGAEGMDNGLEWPGSIVDNEVDIAKEAVELSREHDIWQSSQRRIEPLLAAGFSTKIHSLLFKKRLDELHNNLQSHRKSNFIGQMLSHHTLKSTEYMSKWISSKNRSTE